MLPNKTSTEMTVMDSVRVSVHFLQINVERNAFRKGSRLGLGIVHFISIPVSKRYSVYDTSA